MEENRDPVYSGHVVEFVAVAAEFCRYAENATGMKGKEILDILQRLLPLLYLKATFLPALEPFFEDGNEKFVTESDWFRINDSFKARLDNADDYVRVPDGHNILAEDMIPGSISEDMADIYQDMKNFILLYQTGTSEVMNDAVWECKMNFEIFWGSKLLNSLRAIHVFQVSGQGIGTGNTEKGPVQEGDHSDWFISRRQKEFREENE